MRETRLASLQSNWNSVNGRQAERLPRILRKNLASRRLALPSALALAADELLDAAVGFVVGHLHGRMLGKIGGGGVQHAADSAIERQVAAADRVDGYAGRGWGVFHGKLEIDFHRHI